MSNGDLRERIQSTLTSVPNKNFLSVTKDLLDVLGYQSERTLELSGHPEDFIQQFPAPNENTKTEQAFCENAQSVQLVFQLTSHEIASTGLGTNAFDEGQQQSFIFFSVVLKETNYVRGQYAEFTREINKRINVPTVVFYRAGNMMTIAFVGRRPHKRDRTRDVLEQVTLIKDIRPHNPYRAHLDILAELSLRNLLLWMEANNQPKNFDSLLTAWLDKLDTEELNRQFYRKLFGWFEWAVSEAKFPENENNVLSPQEHIIRLITRILFVWFMKEKGLIAEDLFNEIKIRDLLKNFDLNTGDSYYRAVLQNLFFATLNTEIDKRRFSKQTRADHRNFSVYRYRKEIDDPDRLLHLFAQTPFINGGLFDCLDSFEGVKAGGTRIDCFSDVHYKKLSIPNRLFFDNDGLIALLNHYKFTVEENTPIEQEVALDPELLGKVFENLLAAYNPETHATARKQTGSFYTPRVVVDYMVNEVLTTTLAEKCQSTDGDMAFWQERLRYLLDYEDAFDDANELFEEEEAAGIVRAIAEIKVLDPAVGSGAFPMGMLHKLTLALRRLDPDNTRWEALQKERARSKADAAFETRNQQDRDTELLEISETFERYSGDFGRKLYLIQNSIFGVDIQPIACQIAKLRFFISLAIEQEQDKNAANFGIKPLPNLETRFVAADVLLALDKPAQLSLGQTNAVIRLEQALNENRERHFHATTRPMKLKYRKEDKKLRNNLATELKRVGWAAADTGKIANWDPYDQNAKADWFDAEYMFGVTSGFDVVIGNPPYRQVRKGTYSATQFPYSEGKDKGKQNLYKLFVEQSYNLCKNSGLVTLIVQSSLMCDLSSAATRQLLLEHTQLKHIIEFPKEAKKREAQVFTTVTQGTCIYQFTKASPGNQPIRISVGNDTHTIANLRFAKITRDAILALYPDLRCFPHIKEGSVAILEKIASDKNIKPLRHYAASIVQGDLNLTTQAKRFSSKYSQVRLLRGRNVARFVISYDDAAEYCEPGFMRDKVEANKRDTFLISQEVTGTVDPRRLHFALTTKSSKEFLWGHSVNKTQLKNQAYSKAFLGLLNSKFMDWFFRITSTNNHVQGYELEQLPIPKISADKHDLIATIVDYIIFLKKQPSTDGKNLAHARDYIMVKYFEQIIDGLVYELYLTNELHRAGKYFFKTLLDEPLLPIKEISGDKMSVLRSTFEHLFDRKHPVRKNLFFLDSLETIRIIEGKA